MALRLASSFNRTRLETAMTHPNPTQPVADRPSRRGGPLLAVTPMFSVCALAVCAALIVGGAAKATVDLARAKSIAIAGAEQMRRQAQAVQSFQSLRYADAYGRFAALADDGDASSALIALAMVRHGPGVFGSEWSITPGQLQRWSTLALQDVREHGLALAEHDRGE
jgi:hypothetical protein